MSGIKLLDPNKDLARQGVECLVLTRDRDWVIAERHGSGYGNWYPKGTQCYDIGDTSHSIRVIGWQYLVTPKDLRPENEWYYNPETGEAE